MSELIWILTATFLVSLVSFAGVITLSIKRTLLMKILMLLVAFAAGALIGATFFDLIPEALGTGYPGVMAFVVVGILLFFVVEKILGWHHAHHEHDIDPSKHHSDKAHDKYHHKPIIYLNLIADGIHNFLDGILIASTFIVSVPLGIVTTIAVALHEIPQEIGDFAILIHGGLSIRSALLFNFISAITAIIGGLVAFYFSSVSNITPILLSIGAGGLLYMSLTDLLPEINKENDVKKSLVQFILMLIGILIIYCITLVLPA